MIKPIVKKTLSEEVIGRLGKYIISADLHPGDRLPSENQLAVDLRVSRTTIRDALKSLETVGAIVRRPRHGAVLQEIDLRRMAGVSRFMMMRCADDLDDLFVARRVLEVGMLPMVVHNATKEDYRRMEEAIRLHESQIEVGDTGRDGDIEFHEALVAASRNKLLIQFGNVVHEFLNEVHNEVLVGSDRASHIRGLEEHKKILGYLRAGDVENAQKVLKTHVDSNVMQGRVGARTLEELGEPTPQETAPTNFME